MSSTRSDLIHAAIVLIVILAAGVLRGLHELDNQTVALLYGSALGFAAGRSGTGQPRRDAHG